MKLNVYFKSIIFPILFNCLIIQVSLMVLAIFFSFHVYVGKETYAQTVMDTIPIGPEVGNGIDPVAIAINFATNRLYVANEFSNNVSVIDNSSNKVVAVIDVGFTPADIKINPATNLIYVSNSGSNDVSLIDGETGQVVDTIAVGNTPKGIGINSATNQIYVVNQDSNDINIIDGVTNEVVDTIAAGSKPSHIAVNSVTNLLYVVNSEGNTVNVIDGSNNKSIATIEIGVTINGIGLNETMNHIYVAGCCKNNADIGIDTFAGVIVIVDGFSNKIITEVSIGCSRSPSLSPVCSSNIFGIGVNSVSNKVYVSSFDMYFVSPRDFEFIGFLSVVDGLSFEVTSNIVIKDEPRGIAVDFSNNLIYVVNKGSNDLNVIDGTENSVIKTVNLARLPFDIDFASESKRIYVSNSSSNDVSVINSLTNDLITHVPVGIQPKGLAVNPNDNQIYVTNRESHTLSIIDGLSNEIVNTINVGCNPVDVAINSMTNNIFVALSNELGGNRICDNLPSVKVIDSSTKNIIATIIDSNSANFFKPVSVAINAKTNRIYVADENNNNVDVIDGDINEITNKIKLKGKPGIIDVNEFLNRVYVTTVNSLNVIDGVTEKVIDTVKIGSTLSGLKVNPNKNHIYVNDSHTGILHVINGFTHETIEIVEVGINPQGISLDSQNNLVYVADQDSGQIITIFDDLEVSLAPTSPTIPSRIIANLDTAASSLRLKEAIVTTLDQDGQPLSDITVKAFAKGRGSVVIPASTTTSSDGTAKFRFRFGFISSDGEVTFNVNGLVTSITQE